MLLPVFLFSVPLLTGLAGPDGIYCVEGGIFVCEETAGRVIHVAPDGVLTVIAEGLSSPEGIHVTVDGRVLVVEDTASGRLLEIDNGNVVTLAGDLCYPEGVTVDEHGTIWFSTGGIEGGDLFTTLWKIHDSVHEKVFSLPSTFSFSDLEAANDGLIYICSESSGIFGNVAVFVFDPATSELEPFVTGVVACEGIGMTGGAFPMFITGENGSVHRVDPTGKHVLIEGNLSTVEDVAVFNDSIYITEDGTGSLLVIGTGINE
ncbi:MAG: hypothetical protein KAH54_03815 [Candidatus Sabulitectum sp.]|nr:hypothetical protein [Candidatus Sabulitectum sp.]